MLHVEGKQRESTENEEKGQKVGPLGQNFPYFIEICLSNISLFNSNHTCGKVAKVTSFQIVKQKVMLK